MKAIIFGVSGQDGVFLSALLGKLQVEVIGVSRTRGEFKMDITDFDFVDSLIKKYQPDYVFHLAANSTTRHEALFDNHSAISTGTLNILESVRIHCPSARVFLSGSAMQFANTGLPIDENTPFEASSAYSVARIQSVYAGRYYREAFGLYVYFGYFFNHDSEYRSEKHVNQKIARAAKRIAEGSNEKLELGNVDVSKEFNYAGDIVEAIWLLVNQNNVFEVVIGSGKPYSIQQWVEQCFIRANKNWHDYTVITERFVPEYKILVSNPAVIKSLGWEPHVNFNQLVDIMMKAV